MANIPTTSTTLLRDLAQDSQHARWGELEEKGHFHNYLTGVLRHRALRMMNEEETRAARQRKCAEEASSGGTQFIASVTGGTRSCASDEEAAWRESLLEIALQQLLSDPSIHERTRLVFARVAVNGEKPDEVAASFGIARNAHS